MVLMQIGEVVFGGVGSVHGTLLGVAAIAVLNNGLVHARQPREVPRFEVDPSWPKLPPKWKLGDASSIAIDAQDNVWVLSRPRTLNPDQAATAAPAEPAEREPAPVDQIDLPFGAANPRPFARNGAHSPRGFGHAIR